MIVIIIGMTLVRALQFLSINGVSTSPDTALYLQVAHDIWSGDRPLGFPLLVKLADYDLDRVVVFQFVLSCASWGVLAFVCGRLMREARTQQAKR